MAVILASHKRPMIQWKVTTVAGREEEARKFVETGRHQKESLLYLTRGCN